MIERHNLEGLHFIGRTRIKLLERLQSGIPVIESNPNELASYGMEAIGIIGRSVFLGLNRGEVLDDIRLALKFGVLHFQNAANLPIDKPVVILGKEYKIEPSPITAYLEVRYWKIFVALSVILRDKNSFRILSSSAKMLFGDSFATSSEHQRWEGLLAESFMEDGESKMIEAVERLLHLVEHGGKAYHEAIQLPYLEFVSSLSKRNLVESMENLRKALVAHKLFWGNSDNRGNSNGWISLPLLAACAYAHDHGMDLNVESDYIPRWIVTGDFA
jgi:hypothetical protein